MAVSENDLVVGPLTPAAGVTTISLDFDWTGWEASWLEVYKSGSETPLVLNSDYTVSDAGTVSAVVTLTAPANGTDAYSVFLVTPLERSSDMQLRGEFKSEPFNVEMDRIWQRLQYEGTRGDRALRTSKTKAISGDLSGVGNGQFVKLKPDGSGFVGSDAAPAFTEIAAWFDQRDFDTATAGASFATGTYFVMAGRLYVSSEETGADSATVDLGVDGVSAVPVNGFVHAEQFGIFSTGGMSNATRALAWAADNGAILKFGPHEYTMVETREVLIYKSNSKLHGVRGKTVFRKAAGTNPFRFAQTGAISNIEFKDFEIDTSGTSGVTFKDAAIQDATEQDINGLVMEGVTITADADNMSCVFFGDSETAVMTDFIVRDCKFTAAGKYTYGFALRKQCIGFHYENNECTLSDVESYNNLALYADTQQFTVHGNRFFGGGHSPIAASPAQYGSITGNYVKNDLFFQLANEGGIEAEWKAGHQGGDTSHDIVISGNIVEGNYQWGIFTTARDAGPNEAGVVEPYNITITDNIIINPMNTGVYVRDGNKIRVDGNQITRDAQIGTVGISVNLGLSYSPDEIQITNNIINDQDGEGISVGRFGDDCVVSGNIIRNCQKTGILISDAGDRLRVDGNTVYNTGLATGTAHEGIQIVDANDHLSVCHNLVQRTSRNGIRVDNALENARVDSNTIEDTGNVFSGSDGIRLITLGRGWSVLGNTVNNTPRYGIRLEATLADGGRVNGNFVYTTAPSAAISIACDSSLITDNVVDCGASTQINDGGTGNTVADNVEL